MKEINWVKVDNWLVGLDSVTKKQLVDKYLSLSGRNSLSSEEIALLYDKHFDEFNEILRLWKRDTWYLSSVKGIIENEHFKNIVSMGKAVVPFIVYEIKKNPSNLVWALNLIYKEKLTTDPTLTITEVCKLWVEKLTNK